MIKLILLLLFCTNVMASDLLIAPKVPSSKEINEFISPPKAICDNCSPKDKIKKNGDTYFEKFNCNSLDTFEASYKKSWQFIGKTLEEYEQVFTVPETNGLTNKDLNEFASSNDSNGIWINCSQRKVMEGLRKLSSKYPSKNFQLCRCPASKEAASLFRNCGSKNPIANLLTQFEYSSIGLWSQSGIYQQINGALRSDEHDKICQIMPIAKEAMNGLSKLPGFKGIVYRGGGLPLKVEQEHQVGNIVEYPGFTSTSKDMKVAEHFKEGTSEGTGWLFIINLKKACRDIQSFSRGEGEILCPPGTRFKVTNRIDSKREISIEEVMP